MLFRSQLEHEQSGKRILRSHWTCSSFDNVQSAIDYIESGQHKEKRGDKLELEYAGNIFRHYDSFAFFPAFLKGNEDSKYNLRHAVPTGYTRDEIMDFNDEHEYTVPDTYYEKKVR